MVDGNSLTLISDVDQYISVVLLPLTLCQGWGRGGELPSPLIDSVFIHKRLFRFLASSLNPEFSPSSRETITSRTLVNETFNYKCSFNISHFTKYRRVEILT